MGDRTFNPTPLADILAPRSPEARKPVPWRGSPGEPKPLWAILGEAPPIGWGLEGGSAGPSEGGVTTVPLAQAGQDAGHSSTPDAAQAPAGDVRNPGGYEVSPEVMRRLDAFSRRIGKPVVITGGNRPANSQLGAGRRSQHVAGTAADFYVPDQKHLETANQALESGLFNGVGWYEEGYRGPNGEGPHVHVDLRPLPPRTNPKQWGRTRDDGEVRIPPYPESAR